MILIVAVVKYFGGTSSIMYGVNQLFILLCDTVESQEGQYTELHSQESRIHKRTPTSGHARCSSPAEKPVDAPINGHHAVQWKHALNALRNINGLDKSTSEGRAHCT